MTTDPTKSLVSAVARNGYQLVYLGLRVWWFIRRPQTNGAAVALWHGDQVLLIRTSYRNCYSLPGGFIRPGEPSEQAARRELQEELGVSLPEHLLRHVWHDTIRFESRQDTVDIWETAVDSVPTLHIAGREVVWAGWVIPDDPLNRPLLPHLAGYLDRLAENGTHPG